MTLTIISCAAIVSSYLLSVETHFSEFSMLNDQADDEHNDNSLNRLAYKDHQIYVTTQSNPSSEFEANC